MTSDTHEAAEPVTDEELRESEHDFHPPWELLDRLVAERDALKSKYEDCLDTLQGQAIETTNAKSELAAQRKQADALREALRDHCTCHATMGECPVCLTLTPPEASAESEQKCVLCVEGVPKDSSGVHHWESGGMVSPRVCESEPEERERGLCGDCPPVSYNDHNRCLPCPRRNAESEGEQAQEQAELGAAWSAMVEQAQEPNKCPSAPSEYRNHRAVVDDTGTRACSWCNAHMPSEVWPNDYRSVAQAGQPEPNAEPTDTEPATAWKCTNCGGGHDVRDCLGVGHGITDTERLDWREQNPNAEIARLGDGMWEVHLNGTWIAPTLREAIDAAMRAATTR